MPQTTHARAAQLQSTGASPVCSYNEWDPLEEIIVGTVRGAAHMAYEPALSAYFPPDDPGRRFTGGTFPPDEIEAAEAQLAHFAALLEEHGVVVTRPDPVDHTRPFSTPDFSVPFGHCTACPRDILLVIGDEIIEAPMAQRARFFEYRAYRTLLKDYFRRGARWTAAPKPLMGDDLWVPNYDTVEQGYDFNRHPGLTELEPCFDAACFARCGRDIFWQPDLVSNRSGVEWLTRHLGDQYRIHKIEFADDTPQHVDATMVPLRPGLVLTNPGRPNRDGNLRLFTDSGWEAVDVPPSVHSGKPASHAVSHWIAMNVLCLDERTVVVEASEEPMMELLARYGFDVIPCPFDRVLPFGGSFHCCTVDVRRRGPLQSYFPALDRAD